MCNCLMDISTRGHLELLSPWASRLNRYRPTKVNSVEIDGGKQAPTGYGETGEALRSQSEAVHKTTLQNQVSPGTLGALMEPRKHFLTIKGPPFPPSLSSPAEESGRSTLLPSRPSLCLCLFPSPVFTRRPCMDSSLHFTSCLFYSSPGT